MMTGNQINKAWCSLIISTVLTLCLIAMQQQNKTQSHPTKREIMMMKANNENRHILNLFHLVRNQNLNVVTAYYRTQMLQDGEKNYQKWMNAFAFLHNTVTLYTDDVEIGKNFTNLRQLLSFATVVIIVPKSKSSYQPLTDINKLSLCSNDTSFPITAREDDVCTILFKLIVIEHAIHENYFEKDYHCWLNIKLLHHVVHSKQNFRLEMPFDLSENSVGVSVPRVTNKSTDLDILKGGVYIGSMRSLSTFCKYFKQEALKLYTQRENRKDSNNEYTLSILDIKQQHSRSSFSLTFYGQNASNVNEGYHLLQLMYHEIYE